MRRDGRSIREMGRVLGRSHSTISRELRRNRSPVHHSYIDHRTQMRADKRRSKASRRMRLKNEVIRDYVESKLTQDWSPEQISGRIEIDHPGYFISHEAIYQYVYHPSTPNRQELIGCLRRSHKRRKRKGQAPPGSHQRVPGRSLQAGCKDRS